MLLLMSDFGIFQIVSDVAVDTCMAVWQHGKVMSS